MTEAEWLAATDPTPMLELLRDKASDRKLRLFAVACCRFHWNSLMDERSRAAVETGERMADGLVTESERLAAVSLASEGVGTTLQARQADYAHSEHFIIAARAAGFTVMSSGTFEVEAALTTAAACRLLAMHEMGTREARDVENAVMSSILREVFGPLPFRSGAC
jgi:hypothetical protein